MCLICRCRNFGNAPREVSKTNKTVLAILGVVVVALGIIGFSSVFTVHQTQQALVLQFGKVGQIVSAMPLGADEMIEADFSRN